MGGTEQLVALFADQFEPNGDGYLYRERKRGAPIAVTAAERDGFVARHRWTMRLVSVVAGTVCVAGICAVAILGPQSEVGIYAVMALVVVVYVMGMYVSWRGPARALARRPTLGPARSSEEMQRDYLRSASYWQFAFALPAAAFALWVASARTDILRGWGRLYLVIAAGLVLLGAVQAFRKWRMERSD